MSIVIDFDPVYTNNDGAKPIVIVVTLDTNEDLVSLSTVSPFVWTHSTFKNIQIRRPPSGRTHAVHLEKAHLPIK